MTGPGADVWGSGQYEQIAETLAPMHDALVERLAPQAGERWLDVATGTGGVAWRAAAAGARVTGIDLSPGLVATARRLVAERGLEVQLRVGDAQRLPFADGAFGAVASAVGVVFAPDHHAVARELARVCRAGGRVGVTAWRPEGGVGDFFRVMAPFQDAPPPSAGSSFDWGRPAYVRERLGDAFDLAFEELDCPFRTPSGEDAWRVLSVAYGPTKALAESLSPRRREQLRRAVVEFYEQLRGAAGISHSRQYLLVTGERRSGAG